MLPTTNSAKWWLAGFVDGEGCVYFHPRKRSSQVITITVCDKELRDFAVNCFKVLKIGYRLSDRPGAKRGNRHRWTIEIARAASFQRFSKLIPLRHARKKRRLISALAVCSQKKCYGCGQPQVENNTACMTCRARHKSRKCAKTSGYWRDGSPYRARFAEAQ